MFIETCYYLSVKTVTTGLFTITSGDDSNYCLNQRCVFIRFICIKKYKDLTNHLS